MFCYHCTELQKLFLSCLHGSLPHFQDVDIAPQWLSNSKFVFSKVKLRNSKCVQRLLDSTAGTTTKKINLQCNRSTKFKSSSMAHISLKKQKPWFHLVGVLPLISVPVLHSTKIKNPNCYCIQPQNFLLVSQL